MEATDWIQIGAMVILVALSAYFSSSETAYSSMNRIRIKNLANSGDKRAKTALKLSENYDALLSTILIGNNIVNIMSASIATVVFVRFLGDGGVTVSTVVMTVVVLIFGEISPKSLAKQNAEAVALGVASSLRVLVIVLTPVNFLFTQWKKLLDKLFPPRQGSGITDEELLTMVDEVQNEGSIDEHEGELIRSAIEFNDLSVSEVLTPRVQVAAVEENSTMAEVAEKFRAHGFSRMLVYRDTIDSVLGLIHERDYYSLLYAGGNSIRSIVKEVLFVPPGIKISEMLRRFQENKEHLAVVVDEFGGTAGIVTLEDVLEELVGEIWDEHDEAVEQLRQVEDRCWLVSGTMRLDELREFLNLGEDCEAVTVGGWVIQRLDAIPVVGQSFREGAYEVTVTKTALRRVEEIRVVQRDDKPALSRENN